MMFSLTRFNSRFTPSLHMSVLAILFIALFMRLGFWQMERAREKKQLLTAQYAMTKRLPIKWEGDAPFPAQYQQLNIAGHYLPDIFFLDNQHYNHQFGYNVLSPFVLANEKILLIDRGWQPIDRNRQDLPKIITPTQPRSLSGSVYYPSAKNWLLGAAFEPKHTHITIIELIDTKLVSHILHKSVYPFIIRLNPHEAHGYVREWAIVSMPPARHYGYAVQWFAMAAVVLIIFIALNLKKNI
jgi:surfeit locus 1 family protein